MSNNTTQSLETLFTVHTFSIPQYQRAYSWEVKPHLETFLADLRQQTVARQANPDKTYYLGSLLLHQTKGNHVDIVDGQQRLTTCVIFVAAALSAIRNAPAILNGTQMTANELSHTFIRDMVADKQKLITILEDNPYFRHIVLSLDSAVVTTEAPSALRLKKAFNFFKDNVPPNEWPGLLESLISANVMVYSVSSQSDATLIFELQNDRGKKLTDLESLKSYLMHLVYLHATNPDDTLQTIQTHFSTIYRNVEKQDSQRLAPKEDAILSYHCVAFLKWSSDEWRYPKALIKQNIKSLSRDKITPWVVDFVATLSETYKTVTHLLEDRTLDSFAPLSELIMLGRMATFWPLLIKTYCSDAAGKKKFLLACRLMEVYSLRGGISKLRSDAGMTSAYIWAREFKTDFESLYANLFALASSYDLPARYASGLNRPSLYNMSKSYARYILWRYENHLRAQRGQQVGKIPWKQYLFPENDAVKLTIEHVAAQANPVSKTLVEWDPSVPKPFEEVALHRLGNLVLDSKSANSSKGKYDFSDKLESLSKDSTFLSQGQLIDWAEQNEAGISQWTVESVRKRHKDLLSFATRTWDPATHYKPQQPVAIVEEEDDQDELPSEG